MSLESYSENQSSTLESDRKSEEESLDPIRGEEIYADMVEKQKSLEELDKKIDWLADGITERDKEEVSEVVVRLEAGEVTEDDFLGQFPENSRKRDLAEIILKSMHEMKDYEDLLEKHKPYIIEEFNTLANDLASRFNWDTFLEQCDVIPTNNSDNNSEEKDWGKSLMYNTLSEFAVVREVQQQILEGTINQNYYELLKSYQRDLESSTEKWQQRGFLSEPIQTPVEVLSVEDIKRRRLAFKEWADKVKSDADEYASLKTMFRNYFKSYNVEDDLLEEVIRSLDVEKGYSYAADTWKQYDHDPRYLEAARYFIAKRVLQYVSDGSLPMFETGLKAYIERLRNIDTETALSQIKIEGFEGRSGEILVVTEEQLRDKLKLLVPACFLERIEFLIATDRPEELDKDDPNIETIGKHIPEYDDRGNLVKSHIEIYTSPRVTESADVRERELAELNFYSTALHEVAHSIHHRLNYEDMKEWEKVVKEDPKNVTWYVGYMREKSNLRGLREDFCETFQLAVLNPSALNRLSPERYFYMMKFMGKYMGNVQRKVFHDHVESMITTYLQSKEEFAELIAEEKEKQETNG